MALAVVIAAATAATGAATVPAAGASQSSAVGPTVRLAQPIFTSYDSTYDDTGFNYWDAAFTFHWTVNAPAGICAQKLTYANYDTLGGDVDPILQQESETISVANGARSYAAHSDAPDYDRGGYSVVIRVKDCTGRVVASNPVHTVVSPGEDTDAAITYSGRWSVSHCACASGGTTHWTTARNASVSFRTVQPFDNSGVDLALVMSKAPNRGSAAVYIDGVRRGTLNTYATTAINGTIAYQILLPGSATHLVRIVNLATAGHPRIDLDATINGG